ncbi:MAG: SIS domain-containing protein [Candidatus Hydrogenedentota bacterium]
MDSEGSARAFHASLALTKEAIEAFIDRDKPQLTEAIELLYGCRGKLVVCGMGKCGYIAQKLSATFNSTGTPAVFLHPGEAIHGDLGMAHAQDVALMLSNSGESPEITALAPLLKRMHLKVVAMTGRPDSTLARESDAVINTRVNREADPLDIAPTASTTVMLAAGDALAATLMEKRGFTRDHYARFHPGGALGRRLLSTVESLMHRGSAVPLTHQEQTVREAIFVISSKRLGATIIVDDNQRMVGILTDGDLRRLFEKHEHPLDLTVSAIMTRRPRTIRADVLAADALLFMEENLITSLPVVDSQGAVHGLLHLHDILRAGITG